MNRDTGTQGTAGLVAGIALAAMAVLAAFGNLVAIEPRITFGPSEALEMIWQAGLILFAVHLLMIGHLAYRSDFMPRVFGILLVVAGLDYLIDGLGTVLTPGYAVSIAQFTFVGEVALIFWLLIKGRRGPNPRAFPAPARM